MFMPTFINTERSTRLIFVPFVFSIFTSGAASIGLGVTLPTTVCVLGVDLQKTVAFNEGQLAVGHGAVASERETVGSLAETAATALGTTALQAWRNSGTVGGINGFLSAGPRVLWARFQGSAAPTSGEATLILRVYDVSPRGVL
jgi:hypothetical protein